MEWCFHEFSMENPWRVHMAKNPWVLNGIITDLSVHEITMGNWTVCGLPIIAAASRRGGLQSATTSNLVIPRSRLSTYGTRAFSVAGPVCWNALPDYLKSSDLSFNCFRQQLKTFLFCKYWHESQHYFSALETLLMRSTNACYLLTYLPKSVTWMTLNGWNVTLAEMNRISGAHHKNFNENISTLSAAKCRLMIVVSKNIRYMPINVSFIYKSTEITRRRRRTWRQSCVRSPLHQFSHAYSIHPAAGIMERRFTI